MRIAIDATPAATQYGGVGRYARELLRAIVRVGRENHFILSTAADQTESNRLLAALPPGAWRESRRLPAPERLMTAFWHRLQIPVGVQHWIGQHDVFHGTDFTVPPTDAKKVVTIHDLSFFICPEFAHPRLANYLQTVVPRSIQSADVVIAVSSSVAVELAHAFPGSASKIYAIPNGVVLPAVTTIRDGKDDPVVLAVGTIEPRKNYLTIIQAMAEVRASIPEARLVIIGRRGWKDGVIVEQLRRCQAIGWLDWHENADDTDLEKAYCNATVFVSASHYEGFGLPVLEAMARGIPCIASDIPSHREVAATAALFANPQQPSDFGAAIFQLINDPAKQESLALRGRERAANFTWQETASRTLRTYQKTVSGQLG